MANGGGPAESVTDQGDPSAGGGPSPAPSPAGPPSGGPLLAALGQRAQGMQQSAPGPGDAAASMSMVQTALGMLSQALPGLLGHPLHGKVAQVISRLSRDVSQGTPTAALQRTHIMNLLQNAGRNALMQQVGQGQGQGAGPPGAMTEAPMPSTPLPGA